MNAYQRHDNLVLLLRSSHVEPQPSLDAKLHVLHVYKHQGMIGLACYQGRVANRALA